MAHNHTQGGNLLIILRSLLVALLGFPLLSCDRAPDSGPMRVAVNVWAGNEELFIAETLGLYPQGSVHIVETPLTISMSQAFRGTTIDAAATTLVRALSFAEMGVDLTIVLVLDTSHGADALVAKPEIGAMADLAGQPVGAEMDSVNGYLLIRALENAGLAQDDVVFVDIEAGELSDAYKAGRIAAASVYGPDMAVLTAAGGHVLFDSSMIPGEIVDVLVVRTPYFRENKGKVRDLILGWMRARDALEAWPKDQPRPTGSMTPEEYAEQLVGILPMSADDNHGYFKDDAKALRELLARYRGTWRTYHRNREEARYPIIDTTSFYSALEQFRREREE